MEAAAKYKFKLFTFKGILIKSYTTTTTTTTTTTIFIYLYTVCTRG